MNSTNLNQQPPLDTIQEADQDQHLQDDIRDIVTGNPHRFWLLHNSTIALLILSLIFIVAGINLVSATAFAAQLFGLLLFVAAFITGVVAFNIPGPQTRSSTSVSNILYANQQQVFFPQFHTAGTQLLHFWATVFPNSGYECFKDFTDLLPLDLIKQHGHSCEQMLVSFSRGVLRGKVSRLWVIHVSEIIAVLDWNYLGSHTTDFYASFRILHRGRISLWKGLLLAIALSFLSVIPAIFTWVFLFGTSYDRAALTSLFAPYTWGNSLNYLLADATAKYLLSVALTMALLRGILYFWWLWRHGDGSWGIRQDIDERDRDFATGLSYELYTSIMEVADVLDLERFEPPEGLFVPSFGGQVQTYYTSKRRI